MEIRLPRVECAENEVIRIVRWWAVSGQKIPANQSFVEYGAYLKGAVTMPIWKKTLKCSKSGFIDLKVKQNQAVSAGQILCVINDSIECQHTVHYGGLCVNCGKDISNIQTNQEAPVKLRQVLLPGKKKLTVTKTGLHEMKSTNTEELLSKNKLLLILDIDHTFLHATRNPQAFQVKQHPDFASSVHAFKMPDSASPYHIKIRPKFKEFLDSIRPFFNVVVYTHSVRRYAEKVVEFVNNPQKPIIQNIVARDDFPDSRMKHIDRLFPVDNSMVLILDDRDDVWTRKENVLKIHRYSFWPDMHTQTGHEQPSLEALVNQPRLGIIEFSFGRPVKETEHPLIQHFIEFCWREYKPFGYKIFDQSAHMLIRLSPDEKKMKKVDTYMKSKEDVYDWLINAKCEFKIDWELLRKHEGDIVLEFISKPLIRIHQTFYKRREEKKKADVRRLLSKERRSVLEGCRFVFSGLFPSGMNMKATEIYKKSVEFGAECRRNISPGNVENITHVVTTTPTTSKCLIAFQYGVPVVHPNFVYNSCIHYFRCQETDFQFPKPDKIKVRLDTLKVLAKRKKRRSSSSENSEQKKPKNSPDLEDAEFADLNKQILKKRKLRHEKQMEDWLNPLVIDQFEAQFEAEDEEMEEAELPL